MGVKLSDTVLRIFLHEAASNPVKGITVEEFQSLVYTIYSAKG